VDKLQNDLKQTAEHYKKLQKDKEKLGKEVKRLREEADSDSGQRHLDRHFEDSIKAKDEYETAIRQYKRHFDGAKQENTQLKQQNYEQQREIWQLRNELQRYQCDMVRNDSLSNGKHGAHGGSRHHSHSRTSTPEQEQEKPVRDKAKSVVSYSHERLYTKQLMVV
jgi:chromosome segregation ATPase